MKPTLARLLILLSALSLLGVSSLFALTRPLDSGHDTPVAPPVTMPDATPRPEAPQKPPAPKHFLIVLRLVPRLHDEQAWTDADRAAVGAHFNRLKDGIATGQVLLAGRTEEPLDRTFGLIILTAANEAAARTYMNGDPCIVAGTMTGELHPYGLALMAKGKE